MQPRPPVTKFASAQAVSNSGEVVCQFIIVRIGELKTFNLEDNGHLSLRFIHKPLLALSIFIKVISCISGADGMGGRSRLLGDKQAR